MAYLLEMKKEKGMLPYASRKRRFGWRPLSRRKIARIVLFCARSRGAASWRNRHRSYAAARICAKAASPGTRVSRAQH